MEAGEDEANHARIDNGVLLCSKNILIIWAARAHDRRKGSCNDYARKRDDEKKKNWTMTIATRKGRKVQVQLVVAILAV